MNDNLGYDEIIAAIDSCPKTYLGGILAKVAARASHEYFAGPDPLLKFVEQSIKSPHPMDAAVDAALADPTNTAAIDRLVGLAWRATTTEPRPAPPSADTPRRGMFPPKRQSWSKP